SAYRSRTIIDRNFPSVPGQQQRVIAQTDSLSRLQHPRSGVFDRLSCNLIQNRENIAERTKAGFVSSPASEAFRLAIHESHTALRVGDNNAVADGRQGYGQQFL